MKRHYSCIVVGGGQAGLSVSYCLKQRGVEHVVLDRNPVGHAWRSERWDSFCLVTPNFQCRLPGHSYSGADPQGFMVKEEIVAFVEEYVRKTQPPLQTGVDVHAIRAEALLGGCTLETSEGEISADHVVIATGGYHTPLIPPFASQLPGAVQQLSSRDYKNPRELPEGDVLVVGSGQSGCQIAEDLHLAGRSVHLCLGDAPRSPRRYRGKDVVTWLEEMGYYDTPVDGRPDSDTTREKTNHYVTGRDGGREIDLRRFATEGVKLYGFLENIADSACHFRADVAQRLNDADNVYNGIRKLVDDHIAKARISAPTEPPYVPCWQPDSSPTRLDLREAGITSVIWAIGFRPDFSFIRAPVFDGRGLPFHHRGITTLPGLYFLGLPWLHTWGSGRFAGIAKDAEHLANHVARMTDSQAA